LATADPKDAREVRTQVSRMDQTFHDRAENVVARYKLYIEKQGEAYEYRVDC